MRLKPSASSTPRPRVGRERALLYLRACCCQASLIPSSPGAPWAAETARSRRAPVPGAARRGGRSRPASASDTAPTCTAPRRGAAAVHTDASAAGAAESGPFLTARDRRGEMSAQSSQASRTETANSAADRERRRVYTEEAHQRYRLGDISAVRTPPVIIMEIIAADSAKRASLVSINTDFTVSRGDGASGALAPCSPFRPGDGGCTAAGSSDCPACCRASCSRSSSRGTGSAACAESGCSVARSCASPQGP